MDPDQTAPTLLASMLMLNLLDSYFADVLRVK